MMKILDLSKFHYVKKAANLKFISSSNSSNECNEYTKQIHFGKNTWATFDIQIKYFNKSCIFIDVE